MLHYRRKSFERIHKLLQEILEDVDRIDNVLSCQRSIFSEIVRAEKHILRLKQDRQNLRTTLRKARPDRASSDQLKKQIKRIESRIDAYQQLIYVWRCFGDGIAFAYLDRFAIKQTYFETASLNAKQHAGFMSGKTGVTTEISLVERLIEAGMPALLVDLTNSIRHGDVCLLIGPDPHLIEVKSGERLNNRGRRQASDIDFLHRFFETDEAVGLRTMPKTHRIAVQSAMRNYEIEINECIAQAQRDGYGLKNPEQGLYYLAVYKDDVDFKAIFQQLNIKQAVVFGLNEYKSQRAWSPYYPFSLSIKSTQHLYDFIRGELFLLIILDDERFSREAAALNILVDLKNDSTMYPAKVPHEGKIALSNQLLLRAALEFLSPQWILEHGAQAFAHMKQKLEADEMLAAQASNPGIGNEE